MPARKSTSKSKANTGSKPKARSKAAHKKESMPATHAGGPTQQRTFNMLMKRGMTEAQANAFSKNAGRGKSSRPVTKKVERKK